MEAPCQPYITHDELASCCAEVDFASENSGEGTETLWARTASKLFTEVVG